MSSVTECPICMDVIHADANKVTTECGHNFHCSCLMKNTAHNGFCCPYCRTKMAELPNYNNDSDDDDDDDSFISYDSEDEELSQIRENNALTYFRIFHQVLDGEEPEEEPEEEQLVTELPIPDDGPDYRVISQKLLENGITFEELVKNIMHVSYDYTHNQSHSKNVKEANVLFGNINKIVHRHRIIQEN